MVQLAHSARCPCAAHNPCNHTCWETRWLLPIKPSVTVFSRLGFRAHGLTARLPVAKQILYLGVYNIGSTQTRRLFKNDFSKIILVKICHWNGRGTTSIPGCWMSHFNRWSGNESLEMGGLVRLLEEACMVAPRSLAGGVWVVGAHCHFHIFVT